MKLILKNRLEVEDEDGNSLTAYHTVFTYHYSGGNIGAIATALHEIRKAAEGVGVQGELIVIVEKESGEKLTVIDKDSLNEVSNIIDILSKEVYIDDDIA